MKFLSIFSFFNFVSAKESFGKSAWKKLKNNKTREMFMAKCTSSSANVPR